MEQWRPITSALRKPVAATAPLFQLSTRPWTSSMKTAWSCTASMSMRKPLLALAQRVLLAAAFGEVARDLAEALQPAARVAQRRDDDIGPETAAVAPNAPAFVLEPARLGGQAQFLLGPARRDGGRRIEERERLADDLVGAPALEPLRAVVPALHDAVRIEDEDRVVDDALNEQLEAGLRDRLQVASLFGTTALGQLNSHGCAT
jgi:hypothetical protein